MVKLMGIVCILAGSTGLGLSMARDLELRVGELLQLQRIMLLLRGRIRYMRQPLAEAFRQLGAGVERPFSAFFLATARDLQERNGQSAESIWKKNLDQYLCALHLDRREREELLKLGGMLGCMDMEMQLNILDYYLEQLRLSMQSALEASRSRRRLYQYLGALSGLMLVILLV